MCFIEGLATELAKKERKNITISGPKGRSIRHKSFIAEQNPLGVRAVVSDTEEGLYESLLKKAQIEARISGEQTVDHAFDEALKNQKNLEPLTVGKKAAFAASWGLQFQVKAVEKFSNSSLRELVNQKKNYLEGKEFIL